MLNRFKNGYCWEALACSVQRDLPIWSIYGLGPIRRLFMTEKGIIERTDLIFSSISNNIWSLTEKSPKKTYSSSRCRKICFIWKKCRLQLQYFCRTYNLVSQYYVWTKMTLLFECFDTPYNKNKWKYRFIWWSICISYIFIFSKRSSRTIASSNDHNVVSPPIPRAPQVNEA